MKVIIAGGGTGGHIFPAIAIADEIMARSSKNSVLFIGSRDRMEMQKVPNAGYPIVGLWISGFQRKQIIKNLLLPIKIIYSSIQVLSTFMKFKPDVVVGVGGYSSGPVVRIAILMGICTLIHEQNSYAGVTNQILGAKVNKVCVAYSDMERFFPKEKIILTGNPIRKEIISFSVDQIKLKNELQIPIDKKIILITGGSLGARTLNQCIINNIHEIVKRQDYFIVWQCGKVYYKECNDILQQQKGITNIQLHPFLESMDKYLSIADLVFSRAGALTISELAYLGKAVVFIPSPNVAEDHQTKNAEHLVKKQAAILLKDSEASEQFIQILDRLYKNESELVTMKNQIRKFAMPNAVMDIVDSITQLANQNS